MSINVVIDRKKYELEVADTDRKRQKGLMGRDNLPDHSGMMFIHPKKDRHAYWMKGTKIPLTLLFVGDDLVVKEVHHRPDTNSREYSIPDIPVRIVIEVKLDKNLSSSQGDKIRIMDTQKKAAKSKFLETIKEAELPEPLPEDFLEKVIKLPKKERDKAVQTKLKDYTSQVQQNVKDNLTSALTSLRTNKIEEKTDNFLGDNKS